MPSEDRPAVHIAVRLGGSALSRELAEALAALDYPRERFTISVHAPKGSDGTATAAVLAAAGLTAEVIEGDTAGAARDNAILDRLPGETAHVLLVDGAVTSMPPDAIQRMLGTGRPVVAANVVDETGAPGDEQLFRYEKGAPFNVLYKDGGRDGVVRRDKGFRTSLGAQRVFAMLPLDGVGESFVLIDRAVIEAGVRFAETPYKLHLGAEAFGIMARDRGFEVCGLSELEVVRRSKTEHVS